MTVSLSRQPAPTSPPASQHKRQPFNNVSANVRLDNSLHSQKPHAACTDRGKPGQFQPQNLRRTALLLTYRQPQLGEKSRKSEIHALQLIHDATLVSFASIFAIHNPHRHPQKQQAHHGAQAQSQPRSSSAPATIE